MRAFLTPLWQARRALAFYLCLLLGGWALGHAVAAVVIPDVRPMNEPMLNRMVTVALLVFVIAAAIPFVPGAEIGFALLFLFGADAAPAVYVAMVGALLLSFTIARLCPVAPLVRGLRWLGLAKAAHLLGELAEATPDTRDAVISDRLPGRLAAVALSRRYLTLGLVLNLPGNSVVGGGGGLAFAAGLSGLYRPWRYVLTVLLAVAPVPVILALTA